MYQDVAIRLQKELSERYGEVIGGQELSHVLGFGSMAAMKQALNRQTLTLPVFFIEGRRGRFALSADIALWLAECRSKSGQQAPREMPAGFR